MQIAGETRSTTILSWIPAVGRKPVSGNDYLLLRSRRESGPLLPLHINMKKGRCEARVCTATDAALSIPRISLAIRDLGPTTLDLQGE